MILKSYIFCNSGGGYQQYPKDYSEKFLKRFCAESMSPHQIAVYRDGNLMYYAYSIRKSERELYGLCVVCGELCIKLQSLFEYFQEVLNDEARKGVLFRFDDSGQIKLNVVGFISEKGETEEMFRCIKDDLDRKRIWEPLPSEDYSIPLDTRIVFSFKEDAQEKIVDALRHYHNVFVTLENQIPTSYAATVKRLNLEKIQLQEKSETLQEEIQELSRQKKQYKIVILLAVLFLIGSTVTAIIISNKNADIESKTIEIESLYDTKQDLENNINRLNSDIYDLNYRNSELQKSYEYEHARYEEVQSNYDNLVSKFSNRQPFFITNTSFTFGTGWFEMQYFGLREGEYSIRINVYTEDGDRVCSKIFSDCYFEEGDNSKDFYLTSSLNSGKWYYFEVCNDKIIIGGRMH